MTQDQFVAVAAELYSPAEHLVLSRWFGVTPLVTQPRVSPARALSKVLRGVEVTDFLDTFEAKLPVGVAAIVLKHAQNQLPWWGVVSNGKVTLGRRVRTPTGPEVAASFALFEINWATSGPGFEWPMKYCLTYVPGYSRYVVTQSADCPDAHGACDIAIGHFDADNDPLKETEAIIVGEWQCQAAMGQERFECIFETGLLDDKTVDRMASLVWSEEDAES